MKIFQLFLLFGVVYLASAASSRDAAAAADEEYEEDNGEYDEEDNAASEPAQQKIVGPVKPVEPIDPCICLAVEEPVCGSDGVTYGNICTLNCENRRRSKAGEPQLSIRCFNSCIKCIRIVDPRPVPIDLCLCLNDLYAPVCARNGVTYNNKCLFDCENKRRALAGETPLTLRCLKACNDPTCYAVVEPRPVEPQTQ